MLPMRCAKPRNAATEYAPPSKANPNDSALTKLGLIGESSGRYDQASAHFRKAIELNPINTPRA